MLLRILGGMKPGNVHYYLEADHPARSLLPDVSAIRKQTCRSEVRTAAV